ncbi:hypothetical protein [Adhaeribacter radiodurans]|uniref:STAS/SEC14 domain-containing protein n=1 Tax=Adhaeribacter radiodurans TaxID=2745197 RepID=A0A7L7L6S1_9BACT|nr:hypothetical protein [Adhaeribacter radiodurans]QMU28039.1 hypothetical protein HUW48_08265 [Adhaeribacter radiodurans]
MMVYESDCFELEYLPEYCLLVVRWMGILEIEELVLMIRKIVEVVDKYKIENILLDATYVEASKSLTAIKTGPVLEYFTAPWPLPTIKKIARVTSGHDPYDEAITQQYQTLLQFKASNIEFRNFKHHYEAMFWLIDKIK